MFIVPKVVVLLNNKVLGASVVSGKTIAQPANLPNYAFIFQQKRWLLFIFYSVLLCSFAIIAFLGNKFI